MRGPAAASSRRAASSIGPSDPKFGEAAVTSADEDDGRASHGACAFLPCTEPRVDAPAAAGPLECARVRWSQRAGDAHDPMS